MDGSEDRFCSGSVKIRSTRIGSDLVPEYESVCSLMYTRYGFFPVICGLLSIIMLRFCGVTRYIRCLKRAQSTAWPAVNTLGWLKTLGGAGLRDTRLQLAGLRVHIICGTLLTAL